MDPRVWCCAQAQAPLTWCAILIHARVCTVSQELCFESRWRKTISQLHALAILTFLILTSLYLLRFDRLLGGDTRFGRPHKRFGVCVTRR